MQRYQLELPEIGAIAPGVHFDRIIGRNVLAHQLHLDQTLSTLAAILQTHGIRHEPPARLQLVLAEVVLRHAQRLYPLVPASSLHPDLYPRWQQAEEAIYTEVLKPEITWDIPDLQTLFQAAGFSVTIDRATVSTDLVIAAALVDRWFTPGSPAQPSYADHLSHQLTPDEIKTIRAGFLQLVNQPVVWNSAIAFISGNLI